MEAPPREKRARAAFFCARAANRSAKKQRKKEKLLAKLEPVRVWLLVHPRGAQQANVAALQCHYQPVVEGREDSQHVVGWGRGAWQRLATCALSLRPISDRLPPLRPYKTPTQQGQYAAGA